MFAIDHPLSEAVWHGLGASPSWPSTETLKIICPHLLAVLRGEPTWELDESDKRHWVQKMVVLTRPENDGGPPVSFKEAREVLVAIDDKGRGDALWMMARIVSEQGTWAMFVKPFIEQAWPRQVRFRTENVSRSFAHLVEQSGDSFPDVVRTVVGLLRPVAQLDMITYRLSKEPEEGTNDFARRFPTETLLLLDTLIADDRSQMPHELSNLLDIIAEADPQLRRKRSWRRLYNLTV